eukprot:m.52046 g.52046  ORF g.52046 m.52046 type:complete len:120 (+) comp6348_c0_seq1:674-1033(+)
MWVCCSARCARPLRFADPQQQARALHTALRVPCRRLAMAAAPASAPPVPEAIDPRLLKLVVCPVTKQPLRLAPFVRCAHSSYDSTTNTLVCDTLGLAYPIEDGIPLLIAKQAAELARPI